MLVKNDVRECY